MNEQLFTVTFTTDVMVTRQKPGRGRKVIEQVPMTQPITIERLTEEKALAYRNNTGFTMTPCDIGAVKVASKGSGRDTSVGNGTIQKSRVGSGNGLVSARAEKGAKTAEEKHVAAKTGNLGAAING